MLWVYWMSALWRQCVAVQLELSIAFPIRAECRGLLSLEHLIGGRAIKSNNGSPPAVQTMAPLAPREEDELFAYNSVLCNNYYMGRRRRYKSMTDALREAIIDSDMSYKGIERATEVKRQSIMKFVAGEQSLRLDVADKLAAYFGLEVGTRG
jgi:hypothetical protein